MDKAKSLNGKNTASERRIVPAASQRFLLFKKWTALQWLVHLSALVILLKLVWDYSSGNLTINPIQAATQRTGKTALVFLLLSLACTPLSSLFGWKRVLKVRRTLGLYAFWFAVVHLTIFIGFDYGLDLNLLWLELTQKRYVWVGAGAFSILTLLAITSYPYWMKRLGKNWRRLHRLVYLAGILVITHYAWSKKGDIFSLQGDIIQPLLFGLVLLVLLLLRLPPVRSGIQAGKTWLAVKRA
jgi:sulfoxide reductase heme-binding subunit YedZ